VSGADDGSRGPGNTVDEEVVVGPVDARPGSESTQLSSEARDDEARAPEGEGTSQAAKSMDFASMDRLETRAEMTAGVPSDEASGDAGGEESGPSESQEWDWLENTVQGDGLADDPAGASVSVDGAGSVIVPVGNEVATVNEDSDFHEGQVFDRYVLQSRLGSGAFAEVWRAVETGSLGFAKQVALKILKPGRMDRETRDALIHEARVCGMLHHPHLVDVYGVGEAEGTAYIAMEYVDGITLAVLRSRLAAVGMRLPTSVLLDLGIQLCEGLDYAHTATDHEGKPLHLVHRDLKPGNIMLSWTSGVKIADFGLAKATTSDQTTQAGILRGTPGYIAPEIWTGSRDFQPSVDLFAVGVIFWELAVGGTLFTGPLHPLINTVLNRPVEEEIARLKLYMPSLAPVVSGCLQRDPASRIPSAWAIVEKLQGLRHALRAPGGLELFLSLVRTVADPDGAPETSNRIPAVTTTTDPEWLSVLELATFQTGGFVPPEGIATANFERWGKVSPGEVGSTRDMQMPARETMVAPGAELFEQATRAVDVGVETQRRLPKRSSGYSMGWLVAGAVVLALGVVVGGLVLLSLAGIFDTRDDARSRTVSDAGAEPVEAAVTEASPLPEAIEMVPPPEVSTRSESPTDAETGDSRSDDRSTPSVSPRTSLRATASPSATRARPAPSPARAAAPASKSMNAVAAEGPSVAAEPPVAKPVEAATVVETPSSVDPGPGCVVLRSSPPGAFVKLDGLELGLSGSSVHLVEGRRVLIEMTAAGAPVTRKVIVQRGQRIEVTCDVSFPEAGRTGCKVKLSAAGCP